MKLIEREIRLIIDYLRASQTPFPHSVTHHPPNRTELVIQAEPLRSTVFCSLITAFIVEDRRELERSKAARCDGYASRPHPSLPPLQSSDPLETDQGVLGKRL